MRWPWTRQTDNVRIGAVAGRNVLQTQVNELRRRVLTLEGTVAYLINQDQRGLKDGGLSLKEYMEGVDSEDVDSGVADHDVDSG